MIFLVGLFFSKNKDIDYSETISEEISDLEQQLKALEDKYDLDFNLDDQYQLRERWNNANNTKAVLSNKLNHQHSILSDIQSSIDALAQDISEVKQDIKVSDKMSDERLVDSLKTMNQLKVNDKQLNKLLLENIELNQNLINFYHAQDVTKDSFDEFNKISLFNDLKGWISQYESKKKRNLNCKIN